MGRRDDGRIVRRSGQRDSSHGSESDLRRFARNMFLTGCALAIAAIMLTGTELQGYWALVMVAFVLSQCSMVAIWAANFGGHAAISSIALSAISLCCWWTIAAFDFVAFVDADAECWAIVILTQTVATYFGAALIETFRRRSQRKQRERRSDSKRSNRSPRRVTALTLWTTCAAGSIIAVLAVIDRKHGPIASLTKDQGLAAFTMGLGGALIAVLWLFIFRGSVWGRVAIRTSLLLPILSLIPLAFYRVISSAAAPLDLDPVMTVLPIVLQIVFVALSIIATFNHSRR